MRFRAIVLAGGRGTRMEFLTLAIPKPLLPLGEAPILHHVLNELEDAGADETVVVLADPASYPINQHLDRLGSEAARLWPRQRIVTSFVDATNPFIALQLALGDAPRATLVAHADELVPAAITRRIVEEASRRQRVVCGYFAPARPEMVIGRLGRVEEGLPPDGAADEARLVGRLSIPAEKVSSLRRFPPECTSLIGYAAALRRRGEDVLAVSWPGPYLDLGTRRRYRQAWNRIGGVESRLFTEASRLAAEIRSA